jgi:hypothetical protein
MAQGGDAQPMDEGLKVSMGTTKGEYSKEEERPLRSLSEHVFRKRDRDQTEMQAEGQNKKIHGIKKTTSAY